MENYGEDILNIVRDFVRKGVFFPDDTEAQRPDQPLSDDEVSAELRAAKKISG